MKALVCVVLLIAALVVAFHHFTVHPELQGWRRWMQLKDLDDHEDVVLAFLCLAAGIFLGALC